MASTIQFDADLDDSRLQRSLNSTRTMISRWGRRVTQIFTGVGLVILARKFYNVAEAIRTAYKEQIAAESKLASVSAATGDAAGYTMDQFKQLAANMQDVQGVSDNLAIDMFAIIATFKNIRGDEFEQTAKLAADMSEVLGQDLKSSAIQVAKAMNDPIAGLTALSRVGVSFTDGQKTMIKTAMETGDILTAQGVILAELTSEFGGAAKEQHEMTGRMTDLHNRLGDAAELISQALLPVFTKLADLFEYIVAHVEAFADMLMANKEVISAWADTAAENFKFFSIAVASTLAYTSVFVIESFKKMVAFGAWWNASLIAAAVTLGNTFKWVLTDVLPVAAVFAFEALKANLENMLKAFMWFVNNAETLLKNLMGVIAHVLMGGDPADYEFRALTDGFEMSIAKLRPIAEREIGALENDLGHLVQKLSDTSADIDPFGSASKAASDTESTMLHFMDASFKKKDPTPSPDVKTDPFTVDPVKKEKKKKKEKEEKSLKGNMEGLTSTFDRIFQAAAGRKKDPMQQVAETLQGLAGKLVETPVQIAEFIGESKAASTDMLAELTKIANGITALEVGQGLSRDRAQELGIQTIEVFKNKLNFGVK